MKTENSKQLFEQAQTLMPGGVNSPVRAFRGVGGDPLFIQRGEGAYVIDADGNRYIDYVLSWGPLIAGHAHPAVVEAVQKQAVLGTSFGAPTQLENELAARIIGYLPSIELIRFVNSGTEATMSALRLARAYTGRSKIIKFEGCYHGHADMLLVQAGSGVATLGLPDSPGVPSTATQHTLTAPFNDLEAVRALFEKNPGDIAAIMIEPVAGNMGMVPPMAGFLEGLRELTSAHGALLIFDEVMTGFRVAMNGAQGHYGIQPDLTTLGKVIGGGLPVGAYGGRAEIMAQVAPLGSMYQAGTLSGNPVTMAAGLATLEAIDGKFDRIAEAAAQVVEGIQAAADEAGIPVQTAQVGTMFGFFLNGQPVRNYAEAKTSDTAKYGRLFHALLEEGIYLAPSAFEAGFTSLAHDAGVIEATRLAFGRAFQKIR
jgi:glutamate-1-semialdehyde 2,1-aminomutase